MSGEREEKRAGGSERSSNGTGARKGDAARHRTPDGTRREHASVTPADRGVEGTKACARVKERGRDGERSERGARGRWQAGMGEREEWSQRSARVPLARNRAFAAAAWSRASSLSLARARDRRYEFSRTFLFLSSLSLQSSFPRFVFVLHPRTTFPSRCQFRVLAHPPLIS